MEHVGNIMQLVLFVIISNAHQSCVAGPRTEPLIYLLLDEGQILYDTSKLESAILFSKLKQISGGGFTEGSFPRLRVAFVATYANAPSGIEMDTPMV
jgi:hypothetical protein